MPGRRPLGSSAPFAYVAYGAALFDSCAFEHSGLSAVDLAYMSYASPYDYSELWAGRSGGFEVRGANATLALRICTLSHVAAEWPVVVSLTGSVFSDSPEQLVRC